MSFWPRKEEFLSRPTRVSRLFVILFIFSATLNGLLVFTYGITEITNQKVHLQLEKSATSNLALAQKYKKERDDAQASVAEKNEQLANLNTELSDKSKRLTEIEGQLKTQQAQLAANSAELNQLRGRPPLFSFQKKTSRDVTTDEADVKQIVTAAYDTIVSVYGQPYILHQININFVDASALTISGAAAQITITNSKEGLTMEIDLPSFKKDSFEDVNTIVHEIIHGFHGLAAFDSPIMEEGITVAATDVVMQQLRSQGVIPFDQLYVNITAEQAATLNSKLAAPPATSALYQSKYVASYYTLAGWSWLQLYKSDNQFFKSFNEKLYSKAVNGTAITSNVVRSIIKETVSTANGQPINDYLNGQISFNPA